MLWKVVKNLERLNSQWITGIKLYRTGRTFGRLPEQSCKRDAETHYFTLTIPLKVTGSHYFTLHIPLRLTQIPHFDTPVYYASMWKWTYIHLSIVCLRERSEEAAKPIETQTQKSTPCWCLIIFQHSSTQHVLLPNFPKGPRIWHCEWTFPKEGPI